MKKEPVQLSPDICEPCPFCGEDPFIEPWHGGGKGKRLISCINELCHVQPMVSGGSRTTALKRWNVRFVRC
jgi:hypothetical protein